MSRPLLVDWIEKLVADYNIRDIRFYDDTFTLSKSSVLQFCEELLRRDVKVAWNCYSRVDTIDPEMAALMKRSGCYQVKFGIEAGTDESLRKIKKKILLEQAVSAVELAKRYGLESKASFMFGIHDETIEESQRTLDFALHLDPSFATFQIMMIHPGSEDFKTYGAEGKIPDDFEWDKPLYVSNQNIEYLQKLLDRAYWRFYIRPAFLMRQVKRLFDYPRNQFLRIACILKYFLSSLVNRYSRNRQVIVREILGRRRSLWKRELFSGQ
jgi:magnesium-protoporphyrin IX monomethyl ester (oxidative) cyclase